MHSIARIAALCAAVGSLAPLEAAAQSYPPAPPPCDTACLSEAVHGPQTVGALTGTPPAKNTAGAPNVSKRGVVLFTPGLSAPPRDVQPAFVPKGVIFPVMTMQSYSAYGTPPGGHIRYELTQDVVAGGYLIAMKGDTAEGTIQAAHGGSPPLWPLPEGSDLRVSVDKVYNFCGDTIAVDFDRSEYRDFRGNWNLLMLIGIGFAMKPDKDVHIIRGQKYAAFTSRPQKVCATPTSEPDSTPPADALQTTDN